MRHLLVAGVIAACSSADEPPAKQAPRGSFTADSTIARADYIGPAACGDCHPSEHARWSASLHAVMNQPASPAAVIGKLDAKLAYRGGTMTVARTGDTIAMTVASGERRVRYRVTRTIGKRGLQEYVGIADGTTTEVRLPFAYWPRRGGWYPQPFFDPWLTEEAFDAYAPVTEPWAERCPWCHSTYPFAQRVARGVGFGLEQLYEPPAPGGPALAVDQQVTVGISCESCHLGGRAHAAGAPIHFVPIGATPRPGAPPPTTFAAERANPAIVNRVCAQCHSGPSPRFPDGSATRNSSEAIDLAAAPCTTARCVDCHEPHRADAQNLAAVEASAIAACTRCHAKTAAHGGHESTTCLDCHMPRIVQGIDRHVRSHRISAPTDRAMLAAGAPNACNLCHLDRSIEWTAERLRASYAFALDARAWARAYPHDSVGETWLTSRHPAVRLIAAAAYARSPLGRGVLARIARLLDDPLPYVRAWATFAVEDILGRKLRDDEYDPRLPADARRAQLVKLPSR